MGDEKFHVEIVVDKPTSGMWHCGPNPSWVTVTHLPTMTQARAYGRSQRKARAAAMACVQMMLDDSLSSDDVCSFPEALGDTAALRAEVEQLRANAAELLEAAEAVVQRWDSPDWKSGHTLDFITRLRHACVAVRQGGQV